MLKQEDRTLANSKPVQGNVIPLLQDSTPFLLKDGQVALTVRKPSVDRPINFAELIAQASPDHVSYSRPNGSEVIISRNESLVVEDTKQTLQRARETIENILPKLLGSRLVKIRPVIAALSLIGVTADPAVAEQQAQQTAAKTSISWTISLNHNQGSKPALYTAKINSAKEPVPVEIVDAEGQKSVGIKVGERLALVFDARDQTYGVEDVLKSNSPFKIVDPSNNKVNRVSASESNPLQFASFGRNKAA